MNHEIMTMLEVSEYLRVPVNTLRRWRRLGEGPRSYTIGRLVRYNRSEVEDWFVAQSVKA